MLLSGSYQQTALSPTSGHVVHLSASAFGCLLGTSNLVPRATSNRPTYATSNGGETHYHHTLIHHSGKFATIRESNHGFHGISRNWPRQFRLSPPLYPKGVGPGGRQIRRVEQFLDKRQWRQAPVFPTSTSMKSQLIGGVGGGAHPARIHYSLL